MAHAAVNLLVELTEINCGSCGGVYAITEKYRSHKYDVGESWHCPYCQTGWGYSGNGALQKAQKALVEEQERHKRTLARENEAVQEKLAAERKLKRVARGVCPECKRSFPNLARHMQCKHKASA